MASGRLTADGSTPWVTIQAAEGTRPNISFAGDFGSGTVTLEKQLDGTTYDLLDNGVAITLTDDDDSSYNLAPGMKVRGTLAGSSSPDIDWYISGV